MMENVAELAERSLSQNKRDFGGSSSTLCPRVTEIVNNLFSLFFACCRNFEAYYSNKEKLNIEKTQWIRVFMEEGYTDIRKIEHGVKRVRRESPINPPTIKQFLEWNQPKPEDLGIPDVRDAYNQAIKNSHPSEKDKVWDHDAVEFAWRKTGSRRMLLDQEGSKNETFKLYEYYYNIAIKKIVNGEQLTEVRPAITHNKKFDMDGITLDYRGGNPTSYYIDYKIRGGKRDVADFVGKFKDSIR